PDDDGVGADLRRDPAELGERVTAGGNEGDGDSPLPGYLLSLAAELSGCLLEGPGMRGKERGIASGCRGGYRREGPHLAGDEAGGRRAGRARRRRAAAPRA